MVLSTIMTKQNSGTFPQLTSLKAVAQGFNLFSLFLLILLNCVNFVLCGIKPSPFKTNNPVKLDIWFR